MAELDRSVAADTLVDGRYRVLRRIGSGGMADVYCAEDQQLGRRVALKVLHRRFAEDQEFVERFRREASAAAGLQHPNVVQVFDRGAWDGTYYIAMEFLEGRSLKQMIREDGALPPEWAIDVAIQVLRAARFAHKRGVIHRDIKPHNVIVDPDGRVKVTDFGIARAGASDMTETGAIMGTAQYLSPEQAQGHAVAATSDLYSIGIVLYEMLTARVPFEAESAVTIALKQVNDDPLAPRRLNPRISPELEDVVLRALQKDPAQRFHDADEFISALEAVRHVPARGSVPQRTGPLTGAYPALTEYEAPPYPPYEEEERRSRWFWVGIVIVALALAAIGAGAYLLLRPEKVTVPLVVKLDANTAATKIENSGLQAQIQEVRSSLPADHVIRQSPNPGVEVSKNSTVTITVSTGPGQAEVPDVTDQATVAARKALQQRGFKVAIAREFSDVVGSGHVIETRPGAGTPLNIGSTVTLVVSRGRPQVQVPSVIGKSLADARALLEDAELQVQEAAPQESSTQRPGTVISMSPPAGTTVQKGDVVTLTAAKAPSQVDVPDVVGAQVNDALDALTAAGLRPRTKTVKVATPDQDGVVTAQSPKANSKLKKGSRVTITVGRFDQSQLNPEGSGTVTPTPTVTPTETPTP